MLDRLVEFRSTPTSGFALLGLGCGVGIGAGAPVRLSGVPVLGDAVSGIAVGLGSLDATLGRPSERLRSFLAKASKSRKSSSSSSFSAPSLRLAAGAGCGLGLGSGVGVGLFVKKSAGEALKAKAVAALEKVRGGGKALGFPAAAAAAAVVAPPDLSSISSLEARIDELEGLVCELKPEHGLCAARRKKEEKEEEVEEEAKRKM